VFFKKFRDFSIFNCGCSFIHALPVFIDYYFHRGPGTDLHGLPQKAGAIPHTARTLGGVRSERAPGQSGGERGGRNTLRRLRLLPLQIDFIFLLFQEVGYPLFQENY